MQIKAGYYIDEFNSFLGRLVGEDVVDAFFQDSIGITIEGLPHFFNEEEINPVHKVAWNIITRGEPTRASLWLATTILNKHLGNDAVKTTYQGGEIRLDFNLDSIGELHKDQVVWLLTKFNSLDEESVAELGSSCLKVFRILKDLLRSAQFQVAAMLALFTGKLDVNVNQSISIHSDGFLVQASLDDLNELFDNINALLSETETLADKFIAGNSSDTNQLTIGFSSSSEVRLTNQGEQKDKFYSKVLTDRRIEYGQLGVIVETEEHDKYIQRFEYQSEKQQNAIVYFLRNLFRKKDFKPGQLAIINRALQCNDVIGLLPTGGGKSLTYQICAILQPGVTVVVDPINSLMKDQYDKLIYAGFTKAQFINSFNSKDEREKHLEELTESRYLFLFVSPERFQIEKFRNALGSCKANNVFYSYAVIDEAHCVSEWGHDFRHTYLNLATNLKRFCAVRSKELTLFGLTATASFDVLADVQRELGMKEDAIITLPAQAIDRRELRFEIVTVETKASTDLRFWERENLISEAKYPEIKSILHQMPKRMHSMEASMNYLDVSNGFYEPKDNLYNNAGIIFCPTKSAGLKNGVLAVKEFLKGEDYLKIGTFFSGGDDDVIRDEMIESQAKLSVDNQEDFIRNRTNLMIATKAFGMGIDKPNIRYTLHYLFPNSVESFYQEAGRAGRDGYPALCSILYNPVDVQGNLDFFQNAFNGADREKEIINELLDEVQYEDNFNLNVLKRKVQDQFPELVTMNLWKDRYIYINGPYKENPRDRIKIGLLDLNNNLISYDNATQNFDQAKADKILAFTRDLLNKECPDKRYLDWLKLSSAPGLKTLIQQGKRNSFTLRIGFTNRTVTQMTEKIVAAGYKDFEERIIRSAYNFSSDPEDFLESLHFQYKKFSKYTKSLKLDYELTEYLRGKFHQIRSFSDTQRSIYRMTIAGIVDDYMIDYVGRFIEVKFKAKKDEEYVEHFRAYLKRYLGNQSTNKRISKVKRRKEESILQKVLYTLIEFIEEEITEKRRRSIEYMSNLCVLGAEQGDQAFRENIVFYFTSKYARTDYLPKDTDGGRVENASIVRKYLNYIKNPPDGLGREIDNAKHLRGACSSLRISMREENASIDLLAAFSLFALDAKEEDVKAKSIERPMIKEAVQLYRKGFKRLLRIDTWNEVLQLITEFNNEIVDINPIVSSLVDPLTEELLLNRTSFKLNEFLQKQLKS